MTVAEFILVVVCGTLMVLYGLAWRPVIQRKVDREYMNEAMLGIILMMLVASLILFGYAVVMNNWLALVGSADAAVAVVLAIRMEVY